MKRVGLIVISLIFVVSCSRIFGGDLPYSGPTGCVSGNCQDGEGTYIWSDGAKYEGGWVDGNAAVR